MGEDIERVIVIFDGIFSIRGDYAPIDQILKITTQYNDKFPEGVITVVDDSHGIGAYGATGRGTPEFSSADPDIIIGTFGKAFGVNGGFIAASNTVENAFAAEPVAARSRPLRDLLCGPGSFDLLHFAGHGISEPDDIVNSQIQIEGRVENNMVIPEYLSCTAVEQQSRLKGEDGNGPMVVLNACQTGRMGFRLTSMGGFASAFLKRGAGIFISTLWSVSDQPARDFIIKLYKVQLRILLG